jgi:hypothetical protein
MYMYKTYSEKGVHELQKGRRGLGAVDGIQEQARHDRVPECRSADVGEE